MEGSENSLTFRRRNARSIVVTMTSTASFVCRIETRACVSILGSTCQSLNGVKELSIKKSPQEKGPAGQVNGDG
jgi:hypothetical protein